jgi:phosphoribosylaminoimidazole-succinocarboxamide synthase
MPEGPEGTARAGRPGEAFLGLATIGIRPDRRGKVRELLDLGDRLLMVATDRISAFDYVMPNGVPGRGVVLGRISAFWLRGFAEMIPTHFLSDDPADFPPRLLPHSDVLEGRAMVVRKAERIEVECIVRGYLTGSGYQEYLRDGAVCGVRLPAGIAEFARLPEPIFTPTTKADEGHDAPIAFAELVDQVGVQMAEELRRASLAIYARGAAFAEKRGIVIADTKFEFGRIGGRLALIDEVLTPDSSRFWPGESLGPGRKPVSLDKQYLRDWLLASGWDRNSEPPELPADVIQKTGERYRMAQRLLTGGAPQPSW